MGEFKITQWIHDFNHAMNGSRAKLKALQPDNKKLEVLTKSVEDACNAQRRDVYHRGIRVQLELDANDHPVQPRGDLPSFDWPKSSSTYSEADFRQTEAVDMEGVYLESIHLRRSIPAPFLTPTELVVGNQVVIWIKDHFYENQTAIVREYRPATNEYLVEITSKRPNKRGHTTDPDAKALMYVKLTEVKRCRRNS
jgi:hypothetical protein